ncbi:MULTISPECIES: PhzF family phenazine biosynthesis protein [Pseudoalteromonas]|uniref:Uncharacterized protein n=1 Tax=Pseudoalteromonas amylolytica TaxID=1859457 RepID=A0A1S1MSC4_9GAMM|nr:MULTISPECIES: PhzF family phenazine biosynthesis protein [Pseudoalteromonas]OHU86260.1 hypothetical protein BFC16_16280 [Pseudoalteromonas sp. JW3]OHU89635.1 hypothetical protein BET10_16040 [Pseudoalteromonas amylolytica]
MSDKQASLRYFTPLKEVNSCGQGTLAAASVAFKCGLNQTADWVELQTTNGLIRCYQQSNEQGDYYAFAAKQPTRLLLHLDEERLLALSPDWQKLREVQQQHNVTALFAFSWLPSHKAHVKDRMFSPQMGINEDPVNGNSVIAFSRVLIHLCQSGGQSLPDEIYAYQGFSFDRRGTVRVTLSTHKMPENSVRLAGQVVQLYQFHMELK